MKGSQLFKNKGRHLLQTTIYLKVCLRTKLRKPKKKKIYFDISGVVLNRYLYAFLKVFALQGFTVYVPQNKSLILELNKGNSGESIYKNWLLREGWLKFGKPKDPTATIIKANFSNDYFTAYFDNDFCENHYHVPMCEYPVRYHMYEGFEFNTTDLRKQSIFIAGNMEKKQYAQIGSSRFFNLLSRYKVYHYLQHHKNFLQIPDLGRLKMFLEEEEHFHIIALDTSTGFQIPGEDYKKILSRFHFFLALPGILVPNSHNLTEAMSAGCIPIIQDNYAKFLRPRLKDGINAIFFNDLDELSEKIKYLFNIDQKKVSELRNNVKLYYDSYLSPESVLKAIVANRYDKILIQGEWISLQQYENRKATRETS